MTPNDKIIGFIRTYVPYLIGAGIAWVLATIGLDLRGEFATALIAVVVVGSQNGYYYLVRLLETRFPGTGVLLGFPSAPKYGAVDSLWASFVRTAFPTLIGAGIFALVNIGLQLDAETQTSLIVVFVAIAQVLYYGLARFLISKFPKLTWLLLVDAKPAFA